MKKKHETDREEFDWGLLFSFLIILAAIVGTTYSVIYSVAKIFFFWNNAGGI